MRKFNDNIYGFHSQSEVLDEFMLKKMILQFEKKSLKNQEMRIKFLDAPEK